MSGLVKAAVFGFLIALMGCYQGYQQSRRRTGRRSGHDLGGGDASILILAFDYVLTEIVLQPMSGTVPKIRIRGLSKRFGDKVVLDALDLDVMPPPPS